MKLTLAVASLALLAGCLSPAADTDVPTDVDPTPFLGEGVVWLPPSQGQSRVETLLPFSVNASGMAIVANVALGAQYGPVPLPAPTANVLVELRAPDGTVLAEAELGTDDAEAQLEAEATVAGEHTLALLSYGGSDGGSNGDNVHWRIAAALS